MNNLEACLKLCNAMASAFFPDRSAAEMACLTRGLDPEADYAPKDPAVFRCCVSLVAGFVDSSRSEGGVSLSVRSEAAIKASLRRWCKDMGLDPAQELGDACGSITNISDRW